MIDRQIDHAEAKDQPGLNLNFSTTCCHWTSINRFCLPHFHSRGGLSTRDQVDRQASHQVLIALPWPINEIHVAFNMSLDDCPDQKPYD